MCANKDVAGILTSVQACMQNAYGHGIGSRHVFDLHDGVHENMLTDAQAKVRQNRAITI